MLQYDVNRLLFVCEGPGCQDTKVDLFVWTAAQELLHVVH